MIGMQKFIEETTKITGAIKQAKKLEGVEEVMVPGERGDKIRSKILDSMVFDKGDDAHCPTALWTDERVDLAN